jgi:hypothetical protein
MQRDKVLYFIKAAAAVYLVREHGVELTVVGNVMDDRELTNMPRSL